MPYIFTLISYQPYCFCVCVCVFLGVRQRACGCYLINVYKLRRTPTDVTCCQRHWDPVDSPSAESAGLSCTAHCTPNQPCSASRRAESGPAVHHRWHRRTKTSPEPERKTQYKIFIPYWLMQNKEIYTKVALKYHSLNLVSIRILNTFFNKLN